MNAGKIMVSCPLSAADFSLLWTASKGDGLIEFSELVPRSFAGVTITLLGRRICTLRRRELLPCCATSPNCEDEMVYHVLADLVLMVHFAFVLFAVLGGFLVLKWRSLAWIHVPVFLWATLIELTGWVCPLTPLENWLREKGGGLVYRSDFIEHYILRLLYPATLTRSLQIFLGLLALSFNLGLYGWILWRTARRQANGNLASPN